MELRTPVTGRSQVVRSNEIGVYEEDGRAWLVQAETGERTEISLAGAEMWSRLDGERTLVEIVDELGFPLSDAIEFVRRLRANGFAGDADPGGGGAGADGQTT